MDIRPVRNEDDYDWALKEIERYFETPPARGSDEADRFDVLASLIEAYENSRWPIEPVDPIDALHYRMEAGGFSQADLARLIGSRSRASEILRRRRPLTLPMIQKLHKEWGIPAESLIAPYHLESMG
jgi:HTH-type transcriptional regulator/antitoxin HigA